MRLLRQEGIIYDFPHIYTKIKHEPPTRYLKGSKVNEALVANGCKISGEVQNSILFRGVVVSEHARVKNSIILSKSIIEEGAVGFQLMETNGSSFSSNSYSRNP